MITTGYTPLAEIILQSFTNAHSLDNNGKEKLLIDLLNYVRDITELENLILLIANDNKGKELDILINRYISDNSSVRQFLHEKGVNQIEYIFKNFEYPKSISRLVAMKMLLGKRGINSNLPVFKSLYNELSIYIDVHLHRLITYQKEQIQSKKYNRQCEKSNQMKHQTLDLLDAVGAFMVYEETQAYNILKEIQFEKDRLSQLEAANLFQVTVQTIINWSKKGIICRYKLGNRVFYLKSELIEAARANKGILKI